jgi:hypothetical protein
VAGSCFMVGVRLQAIVCYSMRQMISRWRRRSRLGIKAPNAAAHDFDEAPNVVVRDAAAATNTTTRIFMQRTRATKSVKGSPSMPSYRIALLN